MEYQSSQDFYTIIDVQRVPNIWVYYGHINECGSLLRQLWQATRKNWLENYKTIIELLLSLNACRYKIHFNKDFDNEIVAWLLKNDTYMQYSLDLDLKALVDYKTANILLEEISFQIPRIFDNVNLHINDDNFEQSQSFISKYIEKNHSLENMTTNTDKLSNYFLSTKVITSQEKLLDYVEFLSKFKSNSKAWKFSK